MTYYNNGAKSAINPACFCAVFLLCRVSNTPVSIKFLFGATGGFGAFASHMSVNDRAHMWLTASTALASPSPASGCPRTRISSTALRASIREIAGNGGLVATRLDALLCAQAGHEVNGTLMWSQPELLLYDRRRDHGDG